MPYSVRAPAVLWRRSCPIGCTGTRSPGSCVSFAMLPMKAERFLAPAAKKGPEHVAHTDDEEQTHSHCQGAYPQPALRSAGAFELSLSRNSSRSG